MENPVRDRTRTSFKSSMTHGIATPFIIWLLGISLAGCALPSIQRTPGDADSYEANALDTMADISLGELLSYQQQTYQLEDPLGDHALLNLLHLTAPQIVWRTLTGQGYGALLNEINELRRGYEYQRIGLDRFSGMTDEKPEVLLTEHRKTWTKDEDVFLSVISQEQENGFSPTPGICHRWSSAYRNNPQTGPFPYLFFSKLFWALAYGESSVYFFTENEDQLAQWLVDQEVHSVTLEELFRESYRLNSGDVYLSILTATNVFSRFWFFRNRETLLIATRLKLITAEQNVEEDNYGAWHHFWGMVLFGYCHGKTSARLVGWIESFGSHLVSQYNETDEDYINRYAGELGAELRRQIDNWPITSRRLPLDTEKRTENRDRSNFH